MVNLVSPSYPWLVLTPKVLQLCINHLVLVLYRFVWVVEACQLFLVPSQSSSTPLYPSKVLRARERAPTCYFFVVFSLDSHFSPLKSWEHFIDVPYEAIKEEEQEDSGNDEDCDIHSDQENEEEQPITVLFTLEQLEVLFKMNRPDFKELVVALKGGSSKSVGFKLTKPGNFDRIQD